MTDIQAELYLQDRAYNEGITVEELLDMTPSSVSDCPREAATFWQGRGLFTYHAYVNSSAPC